MVSRIANLAILCIALWTVTTTTTTEAFVVPLPQINVITLRPRTGNTVATSSCLFSTPPRRPRRNLQKRRKRNKDVGAFIDPRNPIEEDDFPWDTAESRPLVSANAIEAGEDYWIDEAELKKQKERAKPPKRKEGQVTDEKLWDEVLSPYRQNWIGLFSMMIVILVVIVTQFPELLQTPVISIPDL